MAVSGVSVVSTATVQGAAAPTLVLQPGTVVTAQVLSVLDANLVRIAIANMSLDVQSLVPLQTGATLQLAVSQTAQGIQLTIVPEGAAQGAAGTAATAATSQATDTSAIARTVLAGDVAAPTNVTLLTPAQAAAVAAAAQNAAARQSGLSSLFANLAATVSSLPAPVQQAATDLLAARPVLTTTLGATDIQSAFANSGLFLEAGLAGGLLMPGQAGGPPDLKGALLVLRQLLTTTSAEAPATAEAVGPAVPVVEVPDATAHGAGAQTPSSPLAPQGGGQVLEAAVLLAGEDAAALMPGGSTPAQIDAATAAPTHLPEAEAPPTAPGGAAGPAVGAAGVPPPYRGAAPSAQAVASPSIAAGASSHEIVQHLVADTDGAIARQTLLQIASLPGQGDAGAADRATARWNFEIPFATPQGTAVAQFEISGDGGGQTAGAGQRVWRARFSLNVEPTGPVHAIVSLVGGTTSVRMWAERPQTAAQLRISAPELGAALRQADLEPGDIVIGDGAPPLPAKAAAAGRFLDRAT
ncbi:MAG: flagellar hook-length control protein FliK [Xanthobacteraceae bacterium]|nr:flagellar hook-length control protein FliK [Xanthobacteraceae bacterium]